MNPGSVHGLHDPSIGLGCQDDVVGGMLTLVSAIHEWQTTKKGTSLTASLRADSLCRGQQGKRVLGYGLVDW